MYSLNRLTLMYWRADDLKTRRAESHRLTRGVLKAHSLVKVIFANCRRREKPCSLRHHAGLRGTRKHTLHFGTAICKGSISVHVFFALQTISSLLAVCKLVRLYTCPCFYEWSPLVFHSLLRFYFVCKAYCDNRFEKELQTWMHLG